MTLAIIAVVFGLALLVWSADRFVAVLRHRQVQHADPDRRAPEDPEDVRVDA